MSNSASKTILVLVINSLYFYPIYLTGVWLLIQNDQKLGGCTF